jgi:hypothetical protein
VSYDPGGKCHRALAEMQRQGHLHEREFFEILADNGRSQALRRSPFVARALIHHGQIVCIDRFYSLTRRGAETLRSLDQGQRVPSMEEEQRAAIEARKAAKRAGETAHPGLRIFERAA